MKIFLTALLLVTVIPIIMYGRGCKRKVRTTLVTTWIIAVIAMYTHLAVIYSILLD